MENEWNVAGADLDSIFLPQSSLSFLAKGAKVLF